VLKEEIRKVSGKAKAERFSNYPYEAIEESLANAVYHRSYEDQNTTEVSVWRDRIEILSYPGPLPPVDNKQLKKPRIIARYYRNRRVGDFLKELGLTEGRGTGIPKIRNAMKKNGSPPPKFQTDQNRTHFLTTLPIHPYTKLEQVILPMGKEIRLNETDKRILKGCLKKPLAAQQIAKILGYPDVTRNVRNSLRKLLASQYLRYSIPEKPNSRNQTYIITESGKRAVMQSEQN
jgi:ATP-dependent DNA helicase RecG